MGLSSTENMIPNSLLPYIELTVLMKGPPDERERGSAHPAPLMKERERERPSGHTVILQQQQVCVKQ